MEKGKAYYLGTLPEEVFLEKLTARMCLEAGIQSLFPHQEGVEITQRENAHGSFFFFLNHTTEEKRILLPKGTWKNLLKWWRGRKGGLLGPRDVAVLKLEIL